MLQPINPTSSPEETEEEKLFKALFEQISGKVSAKPLWVIARYGKRRDTSAGQVTRFLGVCLVVVCCLGTRCHHALCLVGEGCSCWWARRRTKGNSRSEGAYLVQCPTAVYFLWVNGSRWRSPSDNFMHSSPLVFSLFWVLYGSLFLSCNKVQMGDVCVFWGFWYVWLQKYSSNRCYAFFSCILFYCRTWRYLQKNLNMFWMLY